MSGLLEFLGIRVPLIQAHWAGQGAPLARALPAAELVAVLADELSRATGRGA